MNLTEAQRHRIYQVAVAVIALIAAYGILGPDEIPLWTALVVAILGVGTNALAVKNTSPLPPPPPNVRDRGESTLMTIAIVLIIVVLVVFLLGVR